MPEQWKLEGTYMEACTCEAACPCVMLNDPTEGYCTAVVGWHIDEGNYGGISLDDLNVVVALHSPGNMVDGDWKAALYLDDRASAEQQEALGNVFGGQAGGHPGELIGEVVGVATVPLDFGTDEKRGRIGIGDLGGAEWEPIEFDVAGRQTMTSPFSYVGP
ncbi:DUF1326 domain-containing protein [Rubrobacter indicoceani]|uniref:DUF1326 domain-containing protein n=1 Tax=Rubrobacter indicoceani TaxID=2051957 RepID=UPI000E5BBC73|nr:DUF1326 domain-containing protein [Rubrobacter indicoceani]